MASGMRICKLSGEALCGQERRSGERLGLNLRRVASRKVGVPRHHRRPWEASHSIVEACGAQAWSLWAIPVIGGDILEF